MNVVAVFTICLLLTFFVNQAGAKLKECTKPEDLICPTRPLSLCATSANYRWQCPRKCGICADKRPMTVAVDSARSAVNQVINDVISSMPKTNGTTKSLNKFSKIMNQVEQSMGQAQLSRKSYKLRNLKKDIKDATNNGNFKFARRTLGLALYAVSKTKPKSRRKKRSTTDDAKKLLADLKRDLGNEKFAKLFGLRGSVTLMFAIDITGSMWEEIESSKAIVREISKQKRSGSVNYILSTFGDPVDQGFSTREENVSDFLSKIHKLVPDGGGDCEEYALEGMMSAINEDPELESPLFVFTDAPPKDADEENMEALVEMAKEFNVIINFFVEETCKGETYSFKKYNELASAGKGQVFRLKQGEWEKMASFTGNSLNELSPISGATFTFKRKKRSATEEVAFPVDDLVTQLVVTITTTNNPNRIRLVTPRGHTWTAGRTSLSNVLIYEIDSPEEGMWKLFVPSDVGNYEYSASVSSPENIDFEHRFMKRLNKKFLEIRSPLAGELAEVDLTISGKSKLQASSLRVDLIDANGRSFSSNNEITPIGSSGLRFSFTFRPPSKPFRLMLKGKTKSNKTFQRISRHLDGTKSLILKEFYNSKRYTIKRGGKTFIMLYLLNGSNRDQRFTVKFKDSLGYKVSLLGRKVRKVRAKRKKFLRVSVRYNGGKLGRVGQTENVIIIVKGRDDITTEVVSLMVK